VCNALSPRRGRGQPHCKIVEQATRKAFTSKIGPYHSACLECLLAVATPPDIVSPSVLGEERPFTGLRPGEREREREVCSFLAGPGGRLCTFTGKPAHSRGACHLRREIHSTLPSTSTKRHPLHSKTNSPVEYF
jgi:hypothetical protein